jgi:hypothetical protein
MTSIQILPVEEINSISSVYIQNIFIDIQNKTITIEVDKVGQIVTKETLIASGEDYDKIYKGDLLNDFVLASLGFTVRT